MPIYTPEFKTILSNTFNFWGRHWLSIMVLSFIIVGPLFAVDYFFWGNDRLLQIFIDSLTLRGLVAFGYFMNIVLFLIFIFFWSALIRFIDGNAGHENFPLSKALRAAYDNLGRMVGVCLKYGLQVVLWGILFIFPGLYKAAVYSFSGMIAVLELEGDPLLKSQSLIRPRIKEFFKMIGRMVVFLVATFLPIIFLIDTLNTYAIEGFFPQVSVVIGYFVYLLVFFVYLFATVLFYFLYRQWVRVP